MLTVLVSQGFAQFFKFERREIAEHVHHPFIKCFLAATSLVLQTQILGAFLFLELVLTGACARDLLDSNEVCADLDVAYAPTVGWVGIGITSVLALVAFVLWLVQAITKGKPLSR